MKFYEKILLTFIITIFIFTNPFTYAISNDSYIWSINNDFIPVSSNISLENTSNIENNNFLNLESESAILIEQSTGQILYSHNIHEQLRPASVTKIMSILLIMEQIDNGSLSYSDAVTCSDTASSMGGSQIWFEPGETLTVDELLKAICVVSANDRCCCYGRTHSWF